MSSIFSIGLSGLNSAKAALSTTSHNIGNVNTPGYHRQRVSQSAAFPAFEGYGYLGRGVELTAVNRVYNRYLERQLANATTQDANYATQLNTLAQLDDLLGDPATSLSTSISSMFSSLQGINASPESIPARQAAINGMQAFAGNVQLLNTRLEELRQGTNTQIRATVSQINAIASQIADINVQIQSLSQADAMPNDLLDQRDQLVLDLNKLVKADVTVQSDGRYTISIGSGQALVASGEHFPLEVVENAVDPQKLEIAYAGSNGTVRIPDRLFDGGSLSGLINSKAEAINRAQADLGRLVIEVADQMNRQSSLGRDLYNEPGGPLFKDLNGFRPVAVGEVNPATGQVETLESKIQACREAAADFSVVVSDPSRLAVGSSLKAGSLDATQPVQPVITSIWQTAPGNHEDYAPTGKAPDLPAGGFEIRYDAASSSFVVAKPATGYEIVPNGQAAGGFILRATDPANKLTIEFKAEGMGKDDKTFTIGNKASGLDTAEGKADFQPADNANMLEMIKIQTKDTMSSTPNGTTNFTPSGSAIKTTNFEGFFGQLVSFVGSKTNEVKVAAEAQVTTLKETYLARESFSGVNLDEEAANLIRYQQAYQASSKVIQIAQQIFSDLLQMR